MRASEDSRIKAVEPAIRALLNENQHDAGNVLADRAGGLVRVPRHGSVRTWPDPADVRPGGPADRMSYEPCY
ncbi:hypothetical protein ARTHRO9V_160201 [Arthrobacter sp. 9V]|nr:hypothetical protein ARTHRO9V_160201 [Arthrobacter sp. 9V]